MYTFPRSTPVFIILQGSSSKPFVVHSLMVSKATDMALALHTSRSLSGPRAALAPARTVLTGLFSFHVGLIAQLYDYDNILQIATRQLIQ